MAETPGTPAADTSAIDAEVDRMAEDAYQDGNYDDAVFALRITKYAEASLSREVARLRDELAGARADLAYLRNQPPPVTDETAEEALGESVEIVAELRAEVAAAEQRGVERLLDVLDDLSEVLVDADDPVTAARRKIGMLYVAARAMADLGPTDPHTEGG
jgi:hypothetical protein